MDDQNLMDLVESSDEETPSFSKLLSVEDMLLGKGRQEKSLGNLATKFADLLRNSPDGVMHLNKVIYLLLFALFTPKYETKCLNYEVHFFKSNFSLKMFIIY